jgi:hypothetical protein
MEMLTAAKSARALPRLAQATAVVATMYRPSARQIAADMRLFDKGSLRAIRPDTRDLCAATRGSSSTTKRFRRRLWVPSGLARVLRPSRDTLLRRAEADNIAHGRTGATRAQIRAAAEAVDASGFIEALQQRYDSLLAEHGSTLSQGQRQLLSFARAVLADLRILILDLGDQQHRRPHRAAHLDGARTAAERTYQQRLRAPPEHDPRGGSDPGDRRVVAIHGDVIADYRVWFDALTMRHVDQSEAFLVAYSQARGHPWTEEERELAWAAGLWVRVFNAKKATLRPGGETPSPSRLRLEAEVGVRLRQAGA